MCCIKLERIRFSSWGSLKETWQPFIDHIGSIGERLWAYFFLSFVFCVYFVVLHLPFLSELVPFQL